MFCLVFRTENDMGLQRPRPENLCKYLFEHDFLEGGEGGGFDLKSFQNAPYNGSKIYYSRGPGGRPGGSRGAPGGVPGGSWQPPGRLPGVSGRPWEGSWDVPGGPWGPLGGVRGGPGGVPGGPGGVLGGVPGGLGRSWGPRTPPDADFGQIWGRMGIKVESRSLRK